MTLKEFKEISRFVVLGLRKELSDMVKNITNTVDTVKTQLKDKADATHNHDDVYCKETDVDTKLAKAVTEQQDITNSAVSVHNSSVTSHTDIRELVSDLSKRLKAVADSDDVTLDQLSEIVTYIKNNKGLIDSITTSKLNVSDLFDGLTSTSTKQGLTANQGRVLKGLIDEKASTNHNHDTLYAAKDHTHLEVPASTCVRGDDYKELWFYIGFVNDLGNYRNANIAIYFEIILPDYMCQYQKFSVGYGCFGNDGHYIDHGGRQLIINKTDSYYSDMYKDLYIIHDDTDPYCGQIWLRIRSGRKYVVKVTDATYTDNNNTYYLANEYNTMVTLFDNPQSYESLPAYATEDNFIA